MLLRPNALASLAKPGRARATIFYFRVFLESQRFAVSKIRFASSENRCFSTLGPRLLVSWKGIRLSAVPGRGLLSLLAGRRWEPRRSRAKATPAATKQNVPIAKVAGSLMRMPPAVATAGVHHRAK